MRLARARRPFRNLPGTFDALECHAHLAFTGRLRERLHGVAVTIAAAEVHAAIHGRRIALQHLFNQADALEKLAPVECRDEPEAADQIRHERLLGSLVPRFGADGVLNRLSAGRHGSIELLPQGGGRLVFAGALEQPNHKCWVRVRRPGLAGSQIRAERIHKTISIETMGAARRHDVRARAHVFDENQLQHRRPCPKFTHRQRSDRLKSRDEPMQPLRIEPTGAVANQFTRHRVNAGQTRELVSGNPGKPPEERGWQIVVNVAHRGENDVKVIEQPISSGG